MARNNRGFTIIDKVRNTFTEGSPGTVFTTAQIIDKVCKKYPEVNRGSVIPSDYCYNRDNKGKAGDTTLAKFNIFEWNGHLGEYIFTVDKTTGILGTFLRNRDAAR